MEAAFQFLIAHWPFIAFAIVAMVVNQFVKASLFTKARAIVKRKAQWFWWWGWKALPLYPLVIGAIVGAIWANPEGADPAWPRIASIFYFAVAGALSISLYQIIKALAKRKFNLDLDPLPGDNSPDGK